MNFCITNVHNTDVKSLLFVNLFLVIDNMKINVKKRQLDGAMQNETENGKITQHQ